MEINIKTLHLDKNAAGAKDYAAEKFQRLEKFHPRLRGVEITFKENKLQMECDVHLIVDKGPVEIVCVSAGDLHSAVDLALDRCERQLVRAKEKARDSRHSDRRRAAGGTDSQEV